MSPNSIDRNSQAQFNSLMNRANSGDKFAMCKVGECYENGNGVNVSLSKAVSWYNKAVKRGNNEARLKLMYALEKLYANSSPEDQYALGCACLKGDRVEKSEIHGMKMLTIAADRGHTEAQYKLYTVLNSKESRLQKQQAQKWLEIAAQSGHPDAIEALELLGKTNLTSDDQRYERGCHYLAEKKGKGLPTAVEWFKLAAKNYHVKSLEKLYEIYRLNKRYEHTYSDAVIWYKQSKKAGLKNADQSLINLLNPISDNISCEQKVIIANKFLEGDEFFKSRDEGIKWLRMAINDGSIEAAYILATLYEKSKLDFECNQTEKFYRIAAERNHMSAQVRLAKYHENNNGGMDEEAFLWYSKAAKAGDEFAQFKVGHAYESGIVVEQSYANAAEWYTKSMNRGNIDAMLKMASFYEHGYHVNKSLDKACGLYNQAAHKGRKEAEDKIDEILEEEYKDLTADDMYKLAMMFKNGNKYKKSNTKALKWFKKAAEKQHAKSIYEIGLMYESENPVPQSLEIAEKYYLQAAMLNDADAQFRMGMIEKNRALISHDLTNALSWFKKASDQGHVYAYLEYNKIMNLKKQ